MRLGKIEVKRRVWIGLGCAVAATGTWWGWTRRLPPIPEVTAPIRPPFVRLVGAGTANDNRVLRERAELFDPTPLFFPTEWNYGQQPLLENLRRQPGRIFGSFEPKLTFADQSLKPYGAEFVPPPEKLSDVLAQGNEAPFSGIGQIDMAATPLSGRAGFLEVRVFGAAKPILEQALNLGSVPRMDYAPLEFLVVISPAGLVGEPLLAIGSGWDEVDTFFRAYLVKTYRLGERLNHGRYRVLVGP